MNLDRIDTTKLYPQFLIKIEKMLENLNNQGIIYIATQGYRSPEEQAKLYDQGRTTPGKIVTNAKPFSSFHQFGLAIDFVRDMSPVAGVQPSWVEKDYLPLGDAAKLVGLRWGGTFKSIKDFPHVELPIPQSLAQLRAIYLKGGYKAVFAELDKHKWA
jgi:peptidoglycan L-alanyl-D-glutamate endopeptidase CwlK